ncbi:hypothetical protein Hanom_Chr06g00505291 [Helianthus anomalus]
MMIGTIIRRQMIVFNSNPRRMHRILAIVDGFPESCKSKCTLSFSHLYNNRNSKPPNVFTNLKDMNKDHLKLQAKSNTFFFRKSPNYIYNLNDKTP